MNCVKCGDPISERRLRILPNTTTCVKCSKVKPVVGFKVYSHKCTSDVVFVDPDNKEAFRKADNEYRQCWNKNE